MSKKRRAPVDMDGPATRAEVLAAWWAVFGTTDDGEAWPIQIPGEVKSWPPAEAMEFIMSHLAAKDLSDPPGAGSWVAMAEKAVADSRANGGRPVPWEDRVVDPFPHTKRRR